MLIFADDANYDSPLAFNITSYYTDKFGLTAKKMFGRHLISVKIVEGRCYQFGIFQKPMQELVRLTSLFVSVLCCYSYQSIKLSVCEKLFQLTYNMNVFFFYSQLYSKCVICINILNYTYMKKKYPINVLLILAGLFSFLQVHYHLLYLYTYNKLMYSYY